MKYKFEVNGNTFEGSVIKMIGTAFNGMKDYIVSAFRELVNEEKYTDKWNMAKKFLKEYFQLIIFLKENTSKEIHPAVEVLLKASDLEGKEILEFLDKKKTPAISSIARQIRGKINSGDIMDMFIEDVADVEDDDDDW